MITISKADFDNKDKSFKCWAWFLEFSKNTAKCIFKRVPTEVFIKTQVNKYSKDLETDSYVNLSAYNSKDGSFLINIGSSATVKGDIIELNNPHLCYTREEAIELYNSTILNEKDKLTSLYEERINYLNKNLLEKDERN